MIVVLKIIALLYFIPAGNGSQCRGRAACVGLRECAPYIALIDGMDKPLKKSVVNFLRSQECGFVDGYPKVCCSALPKNLRIFKKNPKLVMNLSAQKKQIKLVSSSTQRAFASTPPRFDITVSTGPPSATPVPYIKLINNREQNMGYELFRRRRDSKNSPTEIEIR